MPSPPRLLVFDLDGTLIDSSIDLCNSVNAALAHVGQDALPPNVIASYIGDGAAMLVRRALGDPGDADSEPGARMQGEALFERAFRFFLEFYRIHKLDNTTIYDGVLESLRAIRTRHPALPMAVLTNKPVVPSREICAALGLAPFLFQNYGGNSFASKKPDPEGLAHAHRGGVRAYRHSHRRSRHGDDWRLGCRCDDGAAMWCSLAGLQLRPCAVCAGPGGA